MCYKSSHHCGERINQPRHCVTASSCFQEHHEQTCSYSALLKCKTIVVDDIMIEQLKQPGPVADFLLECIIHAFNTLKYLTAVFVMINSSKLLMKVYERPQDLGFVNILREILDSERFQVHMTGSNSRWRTKKNGLPQGSQPGNQCIKYVSTLAVAKAIW